MRAAPLGHALALLIAAPAAAAVPQRVAAQGRVVDAAGVGVSDIPIRLLQTRRDFQVLEWRFDDEVQMGSPLGRTDANGFFDLTLDPDPEYRFFWLRFYDPSSFDAVRYQLPADRNVTEQMRRGRPVVAMVTLEDHPDWGRLKPWIDALGFDSPRGRLVRRLGFPDLHDKSGGVESFGYARHRRIYRFRDGEPAGEDPWQPPAEAAHAGAP